MEYARELPATPPGGVTAGIDWASADHAVCVVGPDGKAVARFTVEHSAAGLAEMVRRLRKHARARAEILSALLPARRPRAAPRVVKRKMSSYGVKAPGHRDWPQPGCRPEDAVVVLSP